MMQVYLSLGLATLMVGLCQGSLSNHFMDCPGNEGMFNIMRRCCHSSELPNGCECFDISRELTDFSNSMFHTPQCPDSINARFFFYDREYINDAVTLTAGASNIKRSPFVGQRKTVVVTHGFTEYWEVQWMIDMKDALLETEDMNVILVDWEGGAKAPNYIQAVANTRTVGAMVGRLLQDLTQHAGAKLEDIHLVGHSLGAHVMGYAGKEVFRLTDSKVGRISGLDPAGPQFEDYSPYVRLDSSDATFVDVMHTDAEPLLSSGFGIREVIGHADYFPNGGNHQPGCPEETYGIFSVLDIEEEAIAGACSHVRANYLFINSISKCRYDPPGLCGNECTMGYHTNAGCRGVFFPTTTEEKPFC